MSRTSLAVALLLALPPQPGASAQDRDGPPSQAASAAEITSIDFVVRDSQGDVIRDLEAGEVTVYEDGVLQEIEAFGPMVTDPQAQSPILVALVFHRLGRDSGRKAIAAATEWVKLPSAASRRVGVFRIEQRLEMLQDFTGDSARLVDALGSVLTAPSPAEDGETDLDRIRALRHEQGSPGAQDPFGSVELSMVQARLALERDQPGLETTNALLTLVGGLGVAPGRKAAIVFADGFALSDFERHSLKTVTSEAGRARVTFHAVDASGNRFAYDDDLGTLSKDTGGFLIPEMKSLSTSLGQVEEGLRAYYRVSYAPAGEAWDGGYRRVEVKVGRPEVVVQGRQGYFAVSTPTPTPLLENEVPVLSALERTPDADQIPLRVSALQFPDRFGDSIVAIAADLPAGGPSLRQDEGDDTTWTQDFTVLALIRDEASRIVHKTSRRYILSWGQESLDDVEIGRIPFEEEALLPPGTYTVEVAVRDGQAGGMGVGRAPVVLQPADDDELRVSTLMVIGHHERREDTTESPLFFEGEQLYPNLGDPVNRLAFLFTVRPGPGALAAATVELLKADKSVLQSSIPLPSPDPSGQMQVVRELELDGLEPGSYVLRLRVNNATGFQTRSATFTVGS